MAGSTPRRSGPASHLFYIPTTCRPSAAAGMTTRKISSLSARSVMILRKITLSLSTNFAIYFPRFMDIDMGDLARFVDRSENGTPCGHGWGKYILTCPRCQKRVETTRIVMSRAPQKCPRCGYRRTYIWPVIEKVPSDGAWLEPVGWERASIITRN